MRKRRNSKKDPTVITWRSKASATLQKFGKGFMLPISVLPFAGILLGIGGAIGANTPTDNIAAQTIAGIFNGMSQVIFSNFAIMFCIAVVITFTGEAGAAAFLAVIAYLVFSGSQTIFIHFSEDGKLNDILWFHHNVISSQETSGNLANVVTQNLGITSLQTSIFGGVIVGIIVAKVYNKLKYIELPYMLSFFNGIRFIPIVIIPMMFGLSLTFLIFWPWIGAGINFIGIEITKTPAGVDGLIYGSFTRALMPFGLHQIVIATAFTTPFGGVLNINAIQDSINHGATQQEVNILIQQFHNFAGNKEATQIVGDQSIFNYINSVPLNSINGIPLFQYANKYWNVNPGHFMMDYPTYLGACMGIGLALIFTSSKSSRKATASVIGSAMFVSFLVGITEPLEFTFLFIAPVLYYAIYVPMSGISYMLMELVKAHVGTGFSRGFIDLMVYGALPVLKGTRFYYAFLFAAIEGTITFALFYLLIKRLDLATPGRKGNEVVLITKAKYKKLKNKQNIENKEELDERTKDIVEAIGGLENIESITACATRLRTVLKDISKVDRNQLKQLGSSGEIIKGNNIQIIFGGEAIVIAEKINSVYKT